MWTDEYDRVEDGLYLHDPGMPLEVWVGELLGPDPIESKPTIAPKVTHSWGIAGTEEWHEQEISWHKDAKGTWHAETNLYHPKVWQEKLKQKLYESAAKVGVEIIWDGDEKGKLVEFSKYPFHEAPPPSVETIKQVVEYLKMSGASFKEG